MERATFVFKRPEDFILVVEALNDSFYLWWSDTFGEVTVLGGPAIDQLTDALDEYNIKYRRDMK